MAARRGGGQPLALAVEVNANLPYMPGEAEFDLSDVDVVLEAEPPHYDLFAPPKEPVSLTDYAMALYAAALVRDGGTLQIGIGSFSDALAHALILRHTKNRDFRLLLDQLGVPLPPGVQLAPFRIGLYGCTEMLVDVFWPCAGRHPAPPRERRRWPRGHPARRFRRQPGVYELRELPRELLDLTL
jgi:acyl-CoA hydrolase